MSFFTSKAFRNHAQVLQRMMSDRGYTLPLQTTTAAAAAEEEKKEETETAPEGSIYEQLVAKGRAQLQGTTRVGRVLIWCFKPSAADTAKVRAMLQAVTTLEAEQQPQHLLLVADTALHSKSLQKLNESPFRFEVFLYTEIAFNVVDHVDVPAHRLLSPDECQILIPQICAAGRRKAVFAGGDDQGLPKCTDRTCFCVSYITMNDTVARYYHFRPNDMIEICEPSDTVGWAYSHSVIINDTNML